MNLTRTAINRPVFILMLMLLAVLFGTIAFMSMRKEESPEVQFGAITVTSIYPGAGPDEVNTLVSRKIEESISGVNGLLEVTSTSQEGVSIVAAQFNVGTNMDVALNDVRAKVDAVATGLPDSVEKPTITKFDSASDPVMFLVLSAPALDGQQLRDLAEDKLKDRFARIAGVASVNVSGGDVREIQIQVKKDKLIAYQLGILDVQRAITASTLNVPSGRSSEGNKEYSVRVLGEYETFEQIRNTVIPVRDQTRFGGKPSIVRLTDIADVRDSVRERRQYSRLDANDTVVMNIQKAKEGNAVAISQSVYEVIGQIEKEFGVKAVVTQDTSVQIRESLADLNLALLFGIVLVTLIVYIFLHNIRGTLIVAIAIPVCIMGTFVALWALGFTINNMSMLALSLAVGVLVDDCIVVLENIYRHLELGEDPRTAAINGRSEIGLAAIAITLADVVVFIPIAFMGGIVGQFFKPLGIGFAVCVILSLFVSFTVTPMLASRWYRKGEHVENHTGWFASRFERAFGGFEKRYERALEWSLRHRWFVFNAGFAVLIGVFVMIAGGSMPSLDVALQQVGVPMFVATLALGVLIFGINYWRKALRARSAFGVIFAFVVVGIILSSFFPKEIPAPLFVGIVLGLLLAGVAGLLRNISTRTMRSRAFLYGAGFGLFFPFVAALGFQYADWKGDDLFKFQFFPVSDSGSVSIKVEMPPGSTLAVTEEAAGQIEQTVLKNPNTKYVLTNIGTRGGGFSAGDAGTNYAEVRVTLADRVALIDRLQFWKKHEEALRTSSANSVAADILQAIGKIPGASYTVSAQDAIGFGSPIQMSFRSDDRPLLLKTVTEIKERLAQGVIKGIINPDISSKPGKPEIRAIPDRVRLADLGLSTVDVATTMRALYEGNDETKFRVHGKEYDIRIMMDEADRNNPQLVNQVPITFVQGYPIYLGEVARIEGGVGVDKIERRSREEEIRLTADLLPGYAAGTIQSQINEFLDENSLVPEGVRIKELGQADVQARESGYLFGALLLGLVLVYMLLASLYDNLLYPFIIQLAQPQAMVGAILALILTDKALNIVGFVGIITLVGLVGKNAILLVDYTNTLRSRGRPRHEAIVEAGPTRLRPIMMTTIAVILGMLPVALAVGRGSEFRETIGITIIGGVTLSTLLTLLVIPCSYTIFDDLSLALGRSLHRKRADGPLADEQLLEEEESTAPTSPHS